MPTTEPGAGLVRLNGLICGTPDVAVGERVAEGAAVDVRVGEALAVPVAVGLGVSVGVTGVPVGLGVPACAATGGELRTSIAASRASAATITSRTRGCTESILAGPGEVPSRPCERWLKG